MDTFEQNLEKLKNSLENTQGFDEGVESLVHEMQISLQEGASCPLSLSHKEFVRILIVNRKTPDRLKGWAEGVHTYEIALQLSIKAQSPGSISKSLPQPAVEQTIRAEQIAAEENLSIPEKPQVSVETSGSREKNIWMEDL